MPSAPGFVFFFSSCVLAFADCEGCIRCLCVWPLLRRGERRPPSSYVRFRSPPRLRSLVQRCGDSLSLFSLHVYTLRLAMEGFRSKRPGQRRGVCKGAAQKTLTARGCGCARAIVRSCVGLLRFSFPQQRGRRQRSRIPPPCPCSCHPRGAATPTQPHDGCATGVAVGASMDASTCLTHRGVRELFASFHLCVSPTSFIYVSPSHPRGTFGFPHALSGWPVGVGGPRVRCVCAHGLATCSSHACGLLVVSTRVGGSSYVAFLLLLFPRVRPPPQSRRRGLSLSAVGAALEPVILDRRFPR